MLHCILRALASDGIFEETEPEGVDWRGDELVVDVGGGSGSLLRALLKRHPRMRGIVFDLPETVRDAQVFGDRCRFVEGSFFESVPHGDAYLLSTILHDWDDSSAQRILETVRAAAGERLVVLDGVIEPGSAPDGAKWLDLLMLGIAGGRERTAEQWRVLLGDAGWRATRIGKGVIEAQAAVARPRGRTRWVDGMVSTGPVGGCRDTWPRDSSRL